MHNHPCRLSLKGKPHYLFFAWKLHLPKRKQKDKKLQHPKDIAKHRKKASSCFHPYIMLIFLQTFYVFVCVCVSLCMKACMYWCTYIFQVHRHTCGSVYVTSRNGLSMSHIFKFCWACREWGIQRKSYGYQHWSGDKIRNSDSHSEDLEEFASPRGHRLCLLVLDNPNWDSGIPS